jgi:hypothetical protein
MEEIQPRRKRGRPRKYPISKPSEEMQEIQSAVQDEPSSDL